MNNEHIAGMQISVAKTKAPPAPTKPVFQPLSGKDQKKLRQEANKMKHAEAKKYR